MTTSPPPDINDILNRPPLPFALEPVVTTSAELPISQVSVARPRAFPSTPTTTRSRRTGRSSNYHRHRNSSSTVPTSIFPSSSHHVKKPVLVERRTERSPSRASVLATVGSDTGSSSEVNRIAKKREPAELIWGVGQQFSSSEGSSAGKRRRRGRKNYHVVIDQELPGQSPYLLFSDSSNRPIDAQSHPGTIQLPPHHSNWLQLLHVLLNFAVLVVCIGIWFKG